jgi:hypothetical protein
MFSVRSAAMAADYPRPGSAKAPACFGVTLVCVTCS